MSQLLRAFSDGLLMFWPRFEQFADPVKFDQGVERFLDAIQLANFSLRRRGRFRQLPTVHPTLLRSHEPSRAHCLLR